MSKPKYPAWVTDHSTNCRKTYSLRADFGEYYHTREYLYLARERQFDRTDDQQDQRFSELSSRAYEVVKAWREGRNYDVTPQKLYLAKDGYAPKKPIRPLFFRIYNAFVVVNHRVYEALKDCHLGRSSLTKVYIYDPNTDEQLSDIPYYFLNLAERREFVDVENSQGIKRSFYDPQSSDRYLSFPKDGDIILSSEVYDVDVDIWHDPRIEYSLFFSDRAMKQLRQAGFRPNRLLFTGCRTL